MKHQVDDANVTARILLAIRHMEMAVERLDDCRGVLVKIHDDIEAEHAKENVEKTTTTEMGDGEGIHGQVIYRITYTKPINYRSTNDPDQR
jgi:hypothetical protein